ncbi:MAG: pantoate--beta-alanine ligase [Desulfobacteraceae bacterium]|nr:pantoate--beta-alanine ligase [Desulfobacteraceae bacterium]
MEIFKKASEMQSWSKNIKKQDKTICLVPTMGYLHEGHLSLIEKGEELSDKTVLSIFVNPTQFGKNEDLDSYPTDLKKDLNHAEKLNVDAVFLPSKDEMYKKNFQTYVELTNLPNHLCGLSRPVHFKGVATIVAKLFNIVDPDTAIFGQKDYQQIQVIRQMTKDMNFNIQIIGAPIVREDDGLAMSSRNTYLTKEERKAGLCLSQSIEKAKEMIKNGETNADVILSEINGFIKNVKGVKIDYIALCDPETLDLVKEIKGKTLLALAVKLGETRLIDNAVIDPQDLMSL